MSKISLLRTPLPQQDPRFGRNAVHNVFDFQLQHRVYLPTVSEGPSVNDNRGSRARHAPSVSISDFRAVNNQFLVRTKHEIAVTYNGKPMFERLIGVGKLQSDQLLPTDFAVQPSGELL